MVPSSRSSSLTQGSNLSLLRLPALAGGFFTTSAPSESLVKWSESRSVMSNSLPSHGLYSPWNSPGQNTGVGSLSLLQGIYPTQGSNPGLPHCRWILYQLSHKINLPHRIVLRIRLICRCLESGGHRSGEYAENRRFHGSKNKKRYHTDGYIIKCHYTLAESHRMHSSKDEPHVNCGLWIIMLC